MGMKALITGALLASVAGGAMAQSLDPVRIEMFRSILKGNECTLTEGAAANILPRFDFTREETRAIVGALVAAGEVRLDGSTLNLVDGSCSSGDPVADLLGQRNVQQFIAVMAENGCAMNEADAEPVFTARGISKAQVGEVVGPMIQAGMATFEDGVLSVGAAYCSAPMATEETAPVVGSPVETVAETAELDRSGMFGMSRVRHLVDAMAANSCTLNMETPDAFLAEANIEHSFATFVARKMISDGFASMVDEQNMLLPAPYCVSANSPAPVVETPEEPGVDMDMVASLREIFLANSCRLTEGQMDALLPPAGFNKDNIKPVFGYLEANGEMGEDGHDLVFYSDACTAAPAEVATASAQTPELDRSGMFGMSRVRALVDVMAQNGCTLNMEVADGYLAEAGIEHSFATFVATKMISDGFASMADAQNMVLSAPYCIAAGGVAVMAEVETPVETPVETTVETPVEVPTPVMPVNDGTPLGAFISVAAQNSCTMDVSAAAGLLAAVDLRMDQAYRIVDDLVASGQASLSVDGNVVNIDPALCGGGESAAVQAPVESSGIPASPEGVMIAMMRRNSCSMSLSDARAQFPVLGVPANAFDPLLQEYLQDGKIQASADGQTLNFVDPMCYPTPGATALTDEMIDGFVADREAATAQREALLAENEARIAAAMNAQRGEAQVEADPRAGVLAMLAANGCEVTQGNAAELVAAAGLDFNASMQILTQMMGSGEATSPDGGQTLQVSAPLCVAAGVEPMAPREAFIDLIKQNNCSITAAEFSSLLPVNGLDATTAFGMISELEAEGVISLPATRDVVTLSAEMCR